MNEGIFLLHVLLVSVLAFSCRKQSLTAQTTLMVSFALLGNLMVLKQMKLFGLSVTTADVYAVGVILVLNYIRELYDDQAVHQAMRNSFGALMLLAVAAYFQLAYEPLAQDQMSGAYAQLMEQFPKIVAVSAVVYLVVQYLDNRLFSWMKRICGHKYLMGRMLLSLFFSQILDTVLFSVYALDEIAVSLVDIIVFSSLIKIGCSVLMVLNTAISHKLLAGGQKK
jgi:uncharacterized integral membrane protein (TIGR00697 family)